MVDHTNAPDDEESVEDTEESEFTVSRPGSNKVIFSGNEKDVRNYVESNYPRLHAEPGAVYDKSGPPPDVVITSGGAKEFWNGTEWAEVQE
jgi:hypothetical protein